MNQRFLEHGKMLMQTLKRTRNARSDREKQK